MRMIRLTAEYITRIVAGETDLPRERFGPSALALGSFDGIHLGHQALIRAVSEAQVRRNLATSCLFTFRRHPRLVLQDDPEPFLLTTWREKLSVLHDSGIDVVVAADFCPALASLEYREFVGRFLVGFLGMEHFVAGYDVTLGANRAGNARTLEELGKELGYTLEVFGVLRQRGLTISSTAIRKALLAGDTATATAMLGRPYALWGEVTPGDGRGRTIGFPTANITPLFEKKLLPAPGVYAVRIQIPGDAARTGSRNGVLGWVTETLPEIDRTGDIVSTAPSEWALFAGMLNFGTVPTFHGSGLPVPRVEAHVLDFDGDLRGRTVKVDWLQKLRDEQKFAGADELIAQLRVDELAVRRVVAAEPSPGQRLNDTGC